MVVALSIAGVVASMAVPSSGALLDRYRFSSALSQFKMDVTRARMQAIGQNRFVRIKSKSSGYVREVSTDGVSYTQVGATEELPKGVAIQFGSYGGPAFNRQGIASTATVMVISNSQGWKVVVVNVLGRLEVL
jgi:Tfp pilus assembly protein FimT